MKTIIATIFATIIATNVFAEKIPLELPGTYYEIVDDTVLVISGNAIIWHWTVNSKDRWAEYKNNITTIIIEDSIGTVGDNFFYGLPALKRVTMANSVLRIGESVFEKCKNLESVTFSNSLLQIDNRAFYGCSKLTALQFPNSIIGIGDYAFYSCSLTTLQLPYFITEIRDYAFANNEFTSIELPPYVTKIGDDAFTSCFLLKKVTLSASLELLGNTPFLADSNIDTVIILNPNPLTFFLLPFTIDVTNGKAKLFVPFNAVTPFEDILEWNYAFDIIRGGYVTFAHTVTDDNKNGGYVIQPEQRIYQSGEQATFTAIPAEGYRFVNWTTYASSSSKAQVEVSTDSVYICTIGEDNVELTANFEKITSGIAPAATSHSEPVVYTQHRTIVVENTTAAVQLFDLTGRLVAQGIGAGSYSVPQAGVYIVKAGSGVKKVVVR